VTDVRPDATGVDPAAGAHALRPVRTDELEVCAGIWRDSLNDYLGRLGQAEIPPDLGPILRLYAHLRTTDPTTFLVAERDDRIDAFVVAVRRETLWFLSMLFVRPGAQARGLGRRLLAAVSPGEDWSGARATATDSAQPISNGLYGSLGMVPRVPLLRLVGLPDRQHELPPLPDGIEAIRFDEVDGGIEGLPRAALLAELSALDRDAAGFDRAVDRSLLALEGRTGFLFRDRDGHVVGYGHAGESGRVGPVAVRDEELLGPVVGHLVRAVRPRGAFGIWAPGTAAGAIVPLLRAGFRIDGFPVLLCWDRPFGDFARSLPMSPGLL
jgi:GNAT superfamily N-acetyltransferase